MTLDDETRALERRALAGDRDALARLENAWATRREVAGLLAEKAAALGPSSVALVLCDVTLLWDGARWHVVALSLPERRDGV